MFVCEDGVVDGERKDQVGCVGLYSRGFVTHCAILKKGAGWHSSHRTVPIFL